jgi:hypothetical protein
MDGLAGGTVSAAPGVCGGSALPHPVNKTAMSNTASANENFFIVLLSYLKI